MEDLEVQARKQGAAIDRLYREEEDAWFETHSAHLTSEEAEIGVLRFHGRQQAARLRSWWAIQNQGAERLYKTNRLPLLVYTNLLSKREEALQDLNKREQRLEASVAKQLGKHAPPLTTHGHVVREGDELVIHAQTTKTRKKEAARTASHARHQHHKKEVEPETTPVVVVREKANDRAKAAETVRRDLEILQDDMRVLKWTMEDELALLREYDPQGLLSGAEDALNMHQIEIVARLRQEEDVNDAFMRAFEMDAEEKLVTDVTKREREDETPRHQYHLPSRPEKRLTPGGGEDDFVDARISSVHPWLLQSFISQMIKRSPTLAKANPADTARYIGNLARVGSPVVDMAVSAALEETKARELANVVPVYVEMIGAPTGKRGTPKSIARDRRLDDNTKRLYHQTNAAAADAIVASQQFRLGTVGYAGAGIYFATTPEDTDLKAHEKGVTIVATVRLGNVYEMTASERDTTGESLVKMGYDSVYLMRPTGPEYVVYFSDQVLEISILDRTKTTGRPRRQAATKRATIAGSVVEERELITIVPESGSKPAVTVPVNQIGMLNRYDGESYHFPGAEVMFNGMHEVLFRDHGWCGRKHLLGKNSTIIDNITMDGLYNIVMSKKERKWRQYCKKGATDKTQSRWEEYNDQTKKWTPITQVQPTLSAGDTWFLVSWC